MAETLNIDLVHFSISKRLGNSKTVYWLLVTFAKTVSKNKNLLASPSLQDKKRLIAFSLNLTCFSRASGRVPVTSKQHTLSYSNPHVMFCRLMTLVDNQTNQSSFELEVKQLLRLHMVFF